MESLCNRKYAKCVIKDGRVGQNCNVSEQYVFDHQQFKMLKICNVCFSIISVQNLQIPPGCYPVQADLETRNSSDNRVGWTHLVAGDEVPVAGSHH